MCLCGVRSSVHGCVQVCTDVCGYARACVGVCICAQVCVGVPRFVQVFVGVWAGCVWGSAQVCVGVREFSEFLPENRVLTSADFNTYPIRIFFITNDVALNIYYIDIHHQLKEIFNDLNISLMIFQSVELEKPSNILYGKHMKKMKKKVTTQFLMSSLDNVCDNTYCCFSDKSFQNV